MEIIWINNTPYVEDERYANGLRELTLHELEELGVID
jgi:hypothetical protein